MKYKLLYIFFMNIERVKKNKTDRYLDNYIHTSIYIYIVSHNCITDISDLFINHIGYSAAQLYHRNPYKCFDAEEMDEIK